LFGNVNYSFGVVNCNDTM